MVHEQSPTNRIAMLAIVQVASNLSASPEIAGMAATLIPKKFKQLSQSLNSITRALQSGLAALYVGTPPRSYEQRHLQKNFPTVSLSSNCEGRSANTVDVFTIFSDMDGKAACP